MTRVLVLGSGAMGLLFATRLARIAEVTVASGWRAGLEAIAHEGILSTADGRAERTAVFVRHLDHAPFEQDLVLVLTKSYRTATVAPVAAASCAPDGLILTLQNGLGHRGILAEAAGDHRVAAGVTALGATLVAPGQVRRGGPGETAIGAPRVGGERLRQAADLLTSAGFVTEVRTDIEAARWAKLAVNCAINPLTALHRIVNGELLVRPALQQQLVAAAREVGRVAAAAGIRLAEDPAELARGVAQATAENRSSMLQDVERNRPTEIEALNAAVVHVGRRRGVPTPVNARLTAAVRAIGRAPRPVAVFA